MLYRRALNERRVCSRDPLPRDSWFYRTDNMVRVYASPLGRASGDAPCFVMSAPSFFGHGERSAPTSATCLALGTTQFGPPGHPGQGGGGAPPSATCFVSGTAQFGPPGHPGHGGGGAPPSATCFVSGTAQFGPPGHPGQGGGGAPPSAKTE